MTRANSEAIPQAAFVVICKTDASPVAVGEQLKALGAEVGLQSAGYRRGKDHCSGRHDQSRRDTERCLRRTARQTGFDTDP